MHRHYPEDPTRKMLYRLVESEPFEVGPAPYYFSRGHLSIFEVYNAITRGITPVVSGIIGFAKAISIFEV